MEKIAFKMQLKPGCSAIYKQRHDDIWPELLHELKRAGIKDYSIFLEPNHHTLFAVLWRDDTHTMEKLPETPIMQKWWSYMADIMETYPDNSPVVEPLVNVFHLD